MNKKNIFEIHIFSHGDYHEIKKMIIALYNEDLYGEKITSGKIRKTISVLMKKPEKGSIYIFRCFGEISGYAIVIKYWSNEYGGDIYFIDELYVKPQFRKQGIASNFINYLKRQKCKVIQLEVSNKNKKAMRLYIKNSFSMNANRSMIIKK